MEARLKLHDPHCAHHTGFSSSTYPGAPHFVCCHCALNAVRFDGIGNPAGHGPHAPSVTEQGRLWWGYPDQASNPRTGTTPKCDPKPPVLVYPADEVKP